MGEISQSSVSILKNGHIWVSQTTFSESGRFSAFQIVAAPERFHKDRSCLLGHSLEKLIELGHHIWFRFLALVHPSSKLPGENRETYPIIARHAIFYFMSASTLPFFFTLHAQNCVQSKFRKSYSRHFRSQFLRFHSYYFDQFSYRWSMCLSTFEPGVIRKNRQIMIYHGIWLHFPNLQSVVSI